MHSWKFHVEKNKTSRKWLVTEKRMYSTLGPHPGEGMESKTVW